MTTSEKSNIFCLRQQLPYAMFIKTMLVKTMPPIKLRVIRGICAGLMLSSFGVELTSAAENMTSVSHNPPSVSAKKDNSAPNPLPVPVPVTEIQLKHANFKLEPASQESRDFADWIMDSGDNLNMPFLIIDKKQAKVYVFDTNGQLRGAAPALIGLARGDNSIPGIGKMALSSIKPTDRTTPAGRFIAALGRDTHNKEILWVDYDLGIALHRVVTTQPKERRLQRLDSKDPLEHRISYGCINVPIKFYDKVVSPSFTGTNGVVYVLPDTRLVKEVFGSYNVEKHHERIEVKPAI
jgi:hypothetical protein